MMYSTSFLSLRHWCMYAMLAYFLIPTTLFAAQKKKEPRAQHMVQICHYTSYDRSVAEVILVDIESLEDHLAHGDSQEVINCPVQCTPRCDDQNACTIDLCDERKNCLPIEERPLLNCDDNSICTFDLCDPEFGCFHAPNPNACDDNIACTNDFCDASSDPACSHVPDNTACNDNDPCTIDICDVEVGCRYEPNTCDDGNVKTCDQCITDQGCQHIDLSNGCGFVLGGCAENIPIYDAQCNVIDCQIVNINEGNVCFPIFSADTCKSYTCQSGACTQTGSAPDGISCTRFPPPLPGPCVEGAQSCQGGTCLQTKIPDGTICNTSCSDPNAEVCSNGSCITATDGNNQPIPLCSDITYDPCNLTSTICAVVGGFATCGYITDDCGDFNACTNDSCNINTAMCQHTPITPEANCDDGLVCTDDAATCDQFGGLVCTHTFNPNNSTVCQGPLAPCLAQGNDCNDNDACTIDSCNATTGQCSHVFDFSPSNKLCINCNSNADCNPSQYASFLPSCTTSWTGTCISNKCKFVANDNLCPWTNKCQHIQPTCTVTGCSSGGYVSVNIGRSCYKNTCDPATGIISPIKNTSVCPGNNECCYAPSKPNDGTCFAPCSGIGCLEATNVCGGSLI